MNDNITINIYDLLKVRTALESCALRYAIIIAVVISVATALWPQRKIIARATSKLSMSQKALLPVLVAGLFTTLVDFYAGFIALVAGLSSWWVTSYRNPPVQPIPKLKAKVIHGVDGFTFYRFGPRGVPKWLPEWMKAARDESGLIWEGFGMGISKSTEKVQSIAIWLYGSNEGVGHYSYKARDNAFRGSYSEGHFNLMPFEKGSDTWELRVLGHVGDVLSRDIGAWTRPLHVSYDEQNERISMYDPMSGRSVYINENRSSPHDDLFVFGPDLSTHRS